MEMASSSRSGSAFGSDLAGDAGLSFDGAAKVDQEDIGTEQRSFAAVCRESKYCNLLQGEFTGCADAAGRCSRWAAERRTMVTTRIVIFYIGTGCLGIIVVNALVTSIVSC